MSPVNVNSFYFHYHCWKWCIKSFIITISETSLNQNIWFNHIFCRNISFYRQCSAITKNNSLCLSTLQYRTDSMSLIFEEVSGIMSLPNREVIIINSPQVVWPGYSARWYATAFGKCQGVAHIKANTILRILI